MKPRLPLCVLLCRLSEPVATLSAAPFPRVRLALPQPRGRGETARKPKPEIRFFTTDHVDEQFTVFANEPVRSAMVATFLYVELRRDNSLWLAVNDVKLENTIVMQAARLECGVHCSNHRVMAVEANASCHTTQTILYPAPIFRTA
jgi:hypothetical protein